MNIISLFLSVPLRFYHRNRIYGIESNYEVRFANYIANYTILSYLLKYPLFSYKFRWISIQLKLLRLSKNKNYKLVGGLFNLENLKLTGKGNNLSVEDKFKSHSNHIYNNFLYYL